MVRVMSGMRKTLGRAYPSDVTNTLRGLGETLDGLMAGSLEYEMLTDTQVSDEISALNARLVNDIIIQSDKISDEEARQRLWAVQQEIFRLQNMYQGAGVSQSGYAPVATTEEVATIPMNDAEVLLSRFRQAYEMYPSVVDRYGVARPILQAASNIPLVGQTYAAMLSGFDKAMSQLDKDIYFARDGSAALGEFVAQGGSSVQIKRSTFDKIRNWTAQVFQADESLKRLEGIGSKKPAEPTKAATSGVPTWVKVGLAGAALAGIIYWAVQD